MADPSLSVPSSHREARRGYHHRLGRNLLLLSSTTKLRWHPGRSVLPRLCGVRGLARFHHDHVNLVPQGGASTQSRHVGDLQRSSEPPRALHKRHELTWT